MTMTAEQFHQRMWEILEIVDTDYFEALSAPAPEAKAIASLEAAVGFPLPAAFAAFCQRSNGLSVIAREDVWPHAQEFDVGPAWTFWRGLVLLGIDTPELPEWASISAHQRQLAEAGLPGILPVLKIVGDGSRIWGVDQEGTVVVIDDLTDPEPLSGDLTDLYAEQIAELVQRQQDMALRLAERAARKKPRLPG
ncbi:SMI1/KNR4 family protein [Bordetella genomosp. 4]|uniref:SMI1/KNR4 family protein n=1 Tax=Bordetella genomosp. 4 TaxID=463044 RepID=A0A261U5E2_9BORD|nr:SMI1/KNR4 family protein [Bordetella genomosp. 4]OZI49634.1 SMI1/KNR4 family protein [Bordetella genomosp. 4]OZI56073.1 SMI1/KNR4 family protein [Bordetella genomosp. 4]